MAGEADASAPNETGGMLLGYVSPNTAPEDVVVEAVIGPGPNAAHRAARFEPDSAWQQEQLARAYEDSGRTTTYLGDWHTHPGGVAVPSRRDRRTARSIARTTAARLPRPFMVILASDEEGWRAAAYRFQAGRLQAVLIEPLDGG
jgi:integrative and conjugative element protein (TIGR02256 family)